MIRAVLDANVLVSAVLRGGSKPDQIIRRWRRYFEWLTSEYILREVADVLRRKKIQSKYAAQVTSKQRRAFLETVRSTATLVKVKTPVRIVDKDAKDNPIVACAIDGKAGYIVTGDHHLLDLQSLPGIQIVTADRFLKELEQAPLEA